jgi:hypothetical protein
MKLMGMGFEGRRARRGFDVMRAALLAPAGLLAACSASVGASLGSTPAAEPAPMAEEGEPAPVEEPAEPVGQECADPGDRDFADEFDGASPIEATSTTVGCTSRGDVDVFAARAPQAPGGGALIRFRLRGDREMAPLLEIYDSNRKKEHRQQGGKGQELTGWFLAAPGSTVHVRVAQVHGVDESYSLALEASPLGEEGEPNASADDATRLPEAGSARGFMAVAINDPDSLADWYRIEVSRPGMLKIDLDMSESIAAKAELMDGNRKRVARTSGGRSERLQLEATVKKGTYFLSLGSIHHVDSAGKGEVPSFLTRPYVITTSR